MLATGPLNKRRPGSGKTHGTIAYNLPWEISHGPEAQLHLQGHGEIHLEAGDLQRVRTGWCSELTAWLASLELVHSTDDAQLTGGIPRSMVPAVLALGSGRALPHALPASQDDPDYSHF